jgi:hypothetical protein
MLYQLSYTRIINEAITRLDGYHIWVSPVYLFHLGF